MDEGTTTPPFTLDHNQDNVRSSLRSKSYVGADPPDRNQVLFSLTTSKNKQNKTNDNNTIAESSTPDSTEPPSISDNPNHQTINPSETTTANLRTEIPTSTPDTETQTPSPDIIRASETGYVIMNGEELMKVVNNNLKVCVVCKSDERKLVISSTCTLATNFKITCLNCEKDINT